MKVVIPPNLGKVRLMMASGGKYAVWNGKDGRMKFEILCRTRKQAEDLIRIINAREHNGEIEVLS